MTCEERDQDLLLMAHGELSPLRRLRTQAHMASCPRCRERSQRLFATSSLIAGAIRGSDAPPWTPRGLPKGAAVLSVHWAVLLTMNLLFLGLSWLIYAGGVRLLHYENNSAASHRAASPTAPPCRPDLPNDGCR